MTRVRSAKEFDEWFKVSNGDPWGYDSNQIQGRLSGSFEFLKSYLSDEDVILEFGAFNGDFTEKLITLNLPIFSNDISTTAINNLRLRFKETTNVNFLEGDLLNVDLTELKRFRKPAICLLECLYYLSQDERRQAIKRLDQLFPNSSYFISGPYGGHYFTEKELATQIFDSSFELKKIKVLNIKRLGRFSTVLIPVLEKNVFLRSKLANQILYFFKKKDT